MKAKNCLIFGGVDKLEGILLKANQNDYRVTGYTNIHQKVILLKRG